MNRHYFCLLKKLLEGNYNYYFQKKFYSKDLIKSKNHLDPLEWPNVSLIPPAFEKNDRP